MSEARAQRRPLIPVTEKQIASLNQSVSPPQKSRWFSFHTSQSKVPESLSFDKLVNDELQYPFTRREFLDYLIFIDGSAENLQFWTWYRDYEVRFAAATSQLNLALDMIPTGGTDTTLAPCFLDESPEAEAENALENVSLNCRNPVDSMASTCSDPFSTPVGTPGLTTKSADTLNAPAAVPLLPKASFRSLTPAEAQMLNDPETDDLRSFRTEMDRVIATYLMTNARRPLNLTPADRRRIMGSVSCSKHPAVLKTVFSSIDKLLRTHSYPAFVQWTISNSNFARLYASKAVAIVLIILASLAGLVLILSSAARPWRLVVLPFYLLGFTMLLCAQRRLCLFLFVQRRRQVRPWDQFLDEEAAGEKNRQSTTPFGPANVFYEDVWLARYEQRGVLRKVFDRCARVDEQALVRVQGGIIARCVGLAGVLAGAATGVLVGIPVGGLY